MMARLRAWQDVIALWLDERFRDARREVEGHRPSEFDSMPCVCAEIDANDRPCVTCQARAEATARHLRKGD